jgi:hypothetical protein
VTIARERLIDPADLVRLTCTACRSVCVVPASPISAVDETARRHEQTCPRSAR